MVASIRTGPAGRVVAFESAGSESGYRLYSRDDVARLHSIQALRHLGLPLKQIASMLTGDGEALALMATYARYFSDDEIQLIVGSWQALRAAVVVEIAGCGHAPALNTPAQFALVERFLAG